MRQVLVKVVPPATFVLSGIVTSATKVALLVQSGELVGMDASTVGVAGVAGVSVSAGVSVKAAVGSSVTAASLTEISAVAS
jgi:hypothetical protein